MASKTNENSVQIFDLSGGVQRMTSKFLPAQNQVNLSVNGRFDRIGGIEKVPGYTRLGNTITTTSTSSTSSSTSTTSSTSSSSSTSTSTSTSSSTSTSTSTSSTTTMA